MNVIQLAEGVFALTSPERGFGHANVGLVCDADGLTVFDSGPTPAVGRTVRATMTELVGDEGPPLKRLVLSSSRLPFSGGSSAFWPAAVYGSEPTSEALDQPLDPSPLKNLFPQFIEAYRDEEFATLGISHEVGGPAWLTPSTALNVVAADDDLNAVAEVPGAGVIFAGAAASFGVTPLCYAGSPQAWSLACDRLAQSGATLVPGHGPVGDGNDAADLAQYLRACVDADGDPERIGQGPWEGWTDRRFDAVNTERAARLARGDRSIPTSFLELLGLV